MKFKNIGEINHCTAKFTPWLHVIFTALVQEHFSVLQKLVGCVKFVHNGDFESCLVSKKDCSDSIEISHWLQLIEQQSSRRCIIWLYGISNFTKILHYLRSPVTPDKQQEKVWSLSAVILVSDTFCSQVSKLLYIAVSSDNIISLQFAHKWANCNILQFFYYNTVYHYSLLTCEQIVIFCSFQR